MMYADVTRAVVAIVVAAAAVVAVGCGVATVTRLAVDHATPRLRGSAAWTGGSTLDPSYSVSLVYRGLGQKGSRVDATL